MSFSASVVQVAISRDNADWILLSVSIAGFVVSATALVFTANEVRRIRRRMGRRACFDIDFDLGQESPVGDTIRVPPGSPVDLVARIRIDNKQGDRIARHVLINVEAPQYLSDFCWADRQGEKRKDVRNALTTPTGNHPDDDGNEVPMMFLDQIVDEIGRRHDYVFYVHVKIDQPPLPSSVPLRVIVDSDDLPDSTPNGCERGLMLKLESTQS